MASLAPVVAQNGGGGGFSILISLVLLVGVFYFLLIRPQQRRARQQRELMSSLSVGDEVVTVGGILGHITAMDEEFVTLDIAPGTQIRVVKNAVARKTSPIPPDEEIAEDS